MSIVKMHLLPTFLLVLFSCLTSAQFNISSILNLDADKNRLTHEFIQSRGFFDQFHSVKTNDDYFVGLHRLVNPIRSVTRYPVLMISEVTGSSKDWLQNSPGGNVIESISKVGPNLGFELAKRGYDVWLLDPRGNDIYSSNHTSYDAKRHIEYWDFSLDEISLFDFASAFDYIRGVTARSKIGLVTLGRSSTAYFFLASTVKRFNDQIQPMIAAAPVWSQKRARIPQSMRDERGMEIIDLIKLRGQSATRGLTNWLISSVCNRLFIQQRLCNPLLLMLLKQQVPAGMIGSINYDRLSSYLTSPIHESISNWEQAQLNSLLVTDRITMLDVDPYTNLQRYGTMTPPEYFPELIQNSEIHFISAATDPEFDEDDLNEFKQRITTTIRSQHSIPVPWSLLSYLKGQPEEVSAWVNTPVIDILSAYS